jgi:hypothetical protein
MRQRGRGMSKLMLGSVRVGRSSLSIALRGASVSQQRPGDAARDMPSDHPAIIPARCARAEIVRFTLPGTCQARASGPVGIPEGPGAVDGNPVGLGACPIRVQGNGLLALRPIFGGPDLYEHEIG